MQHIITGQEQLPGFAEEDVKRTFKTFSQFMEALPVAGTSLVEDIVRDFRRCAIHELGNTLDRDEKNALVRKQEALLLSLLISVDARVQFELHGSAPRIRSRFTTILMEERARLSFSAARSEALSDHRDLQTETDAVEVRPRDPTNSTLVSQLLHQADAPGASSEELESSHSDAMQTKEAVMERPPRMLRCYSCQNTWVSTLAADLRDCPKCGSYSVFSESPRRAASLTKNTFLIAQALQERKRWANTFPSVQTST